MSHHHHPPPLQTHSFPQRVHLSKSVPHVRTTYLLAQHGCLQTPWLRVLCWQESGVWHRKVSDQTPPAKVTKQTPHLNFPHLFFLPDWWFFRLSVIVLNEIFCFYSHFSLHNKIQLYKYVIMYLQGKAFWRFTSHRKSWGFWPIKKLLLEQCRFHVLVDFTEYGPRWPLGRFLGWPTFFFIWKTKLKL